MNRILVERDETARRIRENPDLRKNEYDTLEESADASLWQGSAASED